MDINKTEMLPGLYGSYISRNKAVGYCKFHKAALTTKTLKGHNCLGKQCNSLVKYEHDFWRQHERMKELRKERKQSLALHYMPKEINYV